MTRLFAMAAELRASGTEPREVHLSSDDEHRLFATAANTFGAAGAEAAKDGTDAWRAFLRGWFETTLQLSLVLDAETTRVAP